MTGPDAEEMLASTLCSTVEAADDEASAASWRVRVGGSAGGMSIIDMGSCPDSVLPDNDDDADDDEDEEEDVMGAEPRRRWYRFCRLRKPVTHPAVNRSFRTPGWVTHGS